MLFNVSLGSGHTCRIKLLSPVGNTGAMFIKYTDAGSEIYIFLDMESSFVLLFELRSGELL